MRALQSPRGPRQRSPPTQAHRGAARVGMRREVRRGHAHAANSRGTAEPAVCGCWCAYRLLRELLEVDAGRNWRSAAGGGEDVDAALVVGQRDVDELVETAGPHHRRVEDVGPVGRADHEDVLLGADAVNLGQDLVDDAVAHVGAAARGGAALLCDRVHLVEEDDARRRLPRLRKKGEGARAAARTEPAMVSRQRARARGCSARGGVRAPCRRASARWPPTLRTTW